MRVAVGPHKYAGVRKTHIRRCRHCDLEFISGNPNTLYAPGHHPKARGGGYGGGHPTRAQSAVNDQTIPASCRVPSVDDGLALRPQACGKCGAQALQERFVDDLIRRNNGRGVGWSCFMCGWLAYAFPGDS